jgi:hypothetical protein
MELNGSLTITLKSEEDIILMGQFLQQRKTQNPRLNEGQPARHEEKEPDRHQESIANNTEIEITNRLKNAFPNDSFTRSQAIELIQKDMTLSPWTIGHFLRKAIERKTLRRLRKGEFTFDAIEEPALESNNASNSPLAENKQKRNLSEKRRSVLKTLQNPLLFFNFVRKLNVLNPEPIDEELINRDLEPQEALNDLKKKYPNLIVYKEEERDFIQEFRNYLESIGIDSPKIQDLVIARMEDDAFSEAELKAFARAQRLAVQQQEQEQEQQPVIQVGSQSP